MIVEEKIAKVGIQGFNKPIKLSMEANSVGFRIIIKNIYSDPIKAIVRELGTNALESHIKAGTVDTPFKVVVPTHDKPEFIIRDFGTGITYDDLRHIYAVMFRSDKRDSNEYNGCFGIGSKSPYAYSDNFNLESYVDGRRFVYTCFIDEEGMPNIAPMFGEEGIPTDEPNGVKITIPVASKDIYQFQNAAKEIYSYFRYKPDINITLPTINYENLPFDNWKVRIGTYRHCNVVMGDVAYKVTVADQMGTHRSLLNEQIDIIANIGDVSVDSGRERIVADAKTIAFIKSRLDEIVNDCNTHVEKQVSSAKTQWELRKMAVKLKSSFMSNYASRITWNGKVYNLTELTRHIDVPASCIIKEFDADGYSKQKYFYPTSKQIVFIDKCVASHLRCMHYCAKNNEEIIGFSCERDVFDKFIQENEITDYLVASNLDRPEPAKRDYDKYKAISKYRNDYFYRARYYDYWVDEQPDFEDGGYYVVVDRGAFMLDGLRRSPDGLGEIINAVDLKTDPKKTVVVYGIPKSLEQEFKDSPDWQNICDVVKDKLLSKWNSLEGDAVLFFREKMGNSKTFEVLSYVADNHVSRLTNPTVKSIMERLAKFDTEAVENVERKYRATFGLDLKHSLDAQKQADIQKFIDQLKSLSKEKGLLAYLPNPRYQGSELTNQIISYLNG